MPKTFANFIAGRWVAPTTGKYFENRNPADTTDLIGHFPLSTSADVDLAVARHEYGERFQPVLNLYRISMEGQNVRQTFVGHGALIQVSAEQADFKSGLLDADTPLGRLLLGIFQFGFVWIAFLGVAGAAVAACSALITEDQVKGQFGR